MGLLDEVRAGGIKGCLGIDQIDGGGGNEIYAFWKVDPCCGSLESAAKCVIAFSCCGWCTMAKFYSSSMGQTWNLIPACLIVTLCPTLAAVATRYGVRKGPGNIVGDCVCTHLLQPLACCQVLRWASNSQWWLLPPDVTIVAPQMKWIK